MLAWIANSAPDKLKATYFAVMASFTNLALSAAHLGTKYLNQFFVVTREVKDGATGAVKVDHDQMLYNHAQSMRVSGGKEAAEDIGAAQVSGVHDPDQGNGHADGPIVDLLGEQTAFARGRLRGQEAGHRRQGHSDTRRQRVPAVDRPQR